MIKHKIEIVENVTNVANINPERPYEQVVADCMKDYLEYRKLEEQGLLLKLPCKTGDKVYFVHSGVNCISESEIDSVEAKKGVIWAKTITNNYFLNTAISKTVFLTKEEAEQKLKEMGVINDECV